MKPSKSGSTALRIGFVEPGFPDHHLRIIGQRYGDNGIRWSLIFDTSARKRLSDHKWRCADELETQVKIGEETHPDDIPAIFERTGSCCYVLYSLLERTDCESIQRWIHTGS